MRSSKVRSPREVNQQSNGEAEPPLSLVPAGCLRLSFDTPREMTGRPPPELRSAGSAARFRLQVRQHPLGEPD